MEEDEGGRELFYADDGQVDVQDESSEISDSDDQFLSNGCGCKKKCCKIFPRDEILNSGVQR